MKKPFILTITGPTASGKSTLKSMLMYRNAYIGAVSTTTRPKRDGEVDGVDYYFVSDEEFDRGIADNTLGILTTAGGYRYGMQMAGFLYFHAPIVAVVDVRGVEEVSKECREKNSRHVACYVGGDDDLLVRLLTRDTITRDNVRDILRRADSILEWSNDASCSGEGWDVAFDHFDADNEELACNVLCSYSEHAIKN